VSSVARENPYPKFIITFAIISKYAFGSQVSVASLSGSNVVVGIANFVGNSHDSKMLAPTLDQVAQWTGQRYKRVLVDKGYHSHGQAGSTTVNMPGKQAHASTYALSLTQKTLCKRRSAIEAIISHLKSEHKLGRNHLKGSVGNTNNALLAGKGCSGFIDVRFFVFLCISLES
jgi:transposase, IS5 family